MPFDGVLFASRVVVAKEAHTSSSVKDLIVAASGVDDANWEIGRASCRERVSIDV